MAVITDHDMLSVEHKTCITLDAVTKQDGTTTVGSGHLEPDNFGVTLLL